MSIAVESKIFESFPDLNIAVVTARKINNINSSSEIIEQILKQHQLISASFNLESLAQDPKIKCWREAYASFRGKPNKSPSSVESLYRQAIEGREPRSINLIVDIYNLISLKHCMPVGGDDLDQINGSIQLRFAEGTESFQTLNTNDFCSPKQGEIIYSDSTDVLCRKWNWRECNKSKMTTETKNVCLVIEALPPNTKSELERAATELAEMVRKFCGGDIQIGYISYKNPEFEF
ncbi:MAG: hypothetical protein H6619_02640 [Deltaproteobacteria bacterium]|nr:hypothetical protein [Deltaproteobacteria bacterium]